MTIATAQHADSNLRAHSEMRSSAVALLKPDFGATLRHVGTDALDLLHRLTTNSLLDMPNGAARRTVLTNEKGRIIDVLWVVKISDAELVLVSDAPRPNDTIQAIEHYTIIEDAELTDASDSIDRWYLTGSIASEFLGDLFAEGDFRHQKVGGLIDLSSDDGEFAFALRTDTAGPETWLVMTQSSAASEIEQRFADADLEPITNDLFHQHRILNRAPIAGHELTDAVNPLEAGLISIIDFDKGCYVGQEVIARLDTYDKVQRRLIQFQLIGDAAAAETISTGDRLRLPSNGQNVGWVTSITGNPTRGNRFGLGYVRNDYSEVGTDLIAQSSAEVKIIHAPPSDV